MYTKLKNDARAAGHPVSEGPDLAQTDLQPIRDFLFFSGSTIGENFSEYDPAPALETEDEEDEEDDQEVVDQEVVDTINVPGDSVETPAPEEEVVDEVVVDAEEADDKIEE